MSVWSCNKQRSSRWTLGLTAGCSCRLDPQDHLQMPGTCQAYLGSSATDHVGGLQVHPKCCLFLFFAPKSITYRQEKNMLPATAPTELLAAQKTCIVKHVPVTCLVFCRRNFVKVKKKKRKRKRVHKTRHWRSPFECTILHMLAQLVLPLLQQVGWHNNQRGLDGHRLPLVVLLLLQLVNRPGGRRRVGQDEHQAL